MQVLLNSRPKKKVVDRNEGIQYIFNQKQQPGQHWQVKRKDGKVIFNWLIGEQP